MVIANTDLATLFPVGPNGWWTRDKTVHQWLKDASTASDR